MSRIASGRVKTRQDVPLVFATDGAAAMRKHQGLWQTGGGWLSTHGHYGAIWTPQPDELAGRDRATVAELRAIAHAVGERIRRGRVTVLSDSRLAARFIGLWRAGDLRMPRGYLGSRKHMPRLMVLALTVAKYPDNLVVEWVPAHAGFPLNECADALAHLGCRQVRDRIPAAEVARRARGLAEAFLADPRCRLELGALLRGAAA